MDSGYQFGTSEVLETSARHWFLQSTLDEANRGTNSYEERYTINRIPRVRLCACSGDYYYLTSYINGVGTCLWFVPVSLHRQSGYLFWFSIGRGVRRKEQNDLQFDTWANATIMVRQIYRYGGYPNDKYSTDQRRLLFSHHGTQDTSQQKGLQQGSCYTLPSGQKLKGWQMPYLPSIQISETEHVPLLYGAQFTRDFTLPDKDKKEPQQSVHYQSCR